jgi:hypothetical protein
VPVHDWQFWVVTLIALIAAALVLRAIIPDKWQPWRKKSKGSKATLTIGGAPVNAKKKRTGV